MTSPASSPRPALQVAVIMRREAVSGPMARWQRWRWVLADVVPQQAAFGNQPRCLLQSDGQQQWLHPGFGVELFRDDAEGYFLNVGSPTPCWFVLWRLDEATGPEDEPLARPVAVSLSYHEAGRWLDAQETVEQVPASPEVVDWLRAFAELHYTPEPRRRQRPQSFQGLQDRFGRPATVSTDKGFGSGLRRAGVPDAGEGGS